MGGETEKSKRERVTNCVTPNRDVFFLHLETLSQRTPAAVVRFHVSDKLCTLT